MAATFADDTSKRIFVNKNYSIFIEISLNCDPIGPVDNKLALA